MTTIVQQIKNAEEEIRKTPYHKGTEHHIGRLRAKISRLKAKVQESKSKKGGDGGGYSIKKQGDATVVLIGPPSAGKSTLLNLLTNANSKVAPYAFTTVSVIPGMMEYNDSRIQILDVPGLIEGAEEGKGRGREVLSVARGADLVILISDIKREPAIDRIKDALYKNGIRLDIVRPNVLIKKKLSGGLKVSSNIKQDLSKETISEVANELGHKNADISINEKLDMDRLIDTFSRNRVYLPSITVLNKSDISKIDKSSKTKKSHLLISAKNNINIDVLKNEIWKKLKFVRIYTVKAGEKPNHNNPLITKEGITLKEIANTIGEEFASDKTKAKIWGSGAKFPGQIVSLSKEVEEGLQVRFI